MIVNRKCYFLKKILTTNKILIVIKSWEIVRFFVGWLVGFENMSVLLENTELHLKLPGLSLYEA